MAAKISRGPLQGNGNEGINSLKERGSLWEIDLNSQGDGGSRGRREKNNLVDKNPGGEIEG